MKVVVPNCESYHVFCLLSSSKMEFLLLEHRFFVLFHYFLEMQITGVKMVPYMTPFEFKPAPVYKPLWLRIGPGLIFGVYGNLFTVDVSIKIRNGKRKRIILTKFENLKLLPKDAKRSKSYFHKKGISFTSKKSKVAAFRWF